MRNRTDVLYRRSAHDPGLAVSGDRPLIGIVLTEDGREVTRSFVDEADADVAVDVLAGAWRDLDRDEAVAELDRIRHESTPTPPIDDL